MVGGIFLPLGAERDFRGAGRRTCPRYKKSEM
jgi:hypothetical protein